MTADETWRDLTPDLALALYRPQVEDSEQALPMVLGWGKDGQARVAMVALEEGGPGIGDILASIPGVWGEQAAVLASGESWMRDMSLDGGDERAPQECVMLSYADQDGKQWTATARFVRSQSGVRWYGGLEVIESPLGDIPRGARIAVGIER